MNKKQKLRNAVILGLLMSSVTASSVWAENLVVENIYNKNENPVATTPGTGLIDVDYKQILGIVGNMAFEKYDALNPYYKEYNQNAYDSISITVKNNYYLHKDENPDKHGGDQAIGITTAKNIMTVD